MSIDHGKLLALAKKLAPLKAMPFEFDNGPAGDDQWCVCTKDSNLTGCDMDKEDAELFAYAVNALAQPAEAVESIAGKFHREVLDPLLSAHHLSVSNADDAAQGVVAWRYRHPVDGDIGTWHDVKDEPVNGPYMQKFLAEGCDIEYAYTHPQAAPAQGDGYSYDEIVFAWEESGVSGDFGDFLSHLGTDKSDSASPGLFMQMGIADDPLPPTVGEEE